MHFLGLAGMPRRIPDYPDAFAAWNLIASYWSYISLVSVAVFLFVIYNSLTENVECSENPWSDQVSNNTESSNTLEWVIGSPPSYHAFNELPAIKDTILTKNKTIDGK